MTVKTVLVALAMTCAPVAALAMGCSEKHEAQSCETGSSWDAGLQRCVKQITS